jgi:hypothetical protein
MVKASLSHIASRGGSDITGSDCAEGLAALCHSPHAATFEVSSKLLSVTDEMLDKST